MQVGHYVIPPVQASDGSDALAFARVSDPKCAAIWQDKVSDPLAGLLLHYAYARVQLAKPQYRWDALSRRGSIACRTGIVHQARVNLLLLLD